MREPVNRFAVLLTAFDAAPALGSVKPGRLPLAFLRIAITAKGRLDRGAHEKSELKNRHQIAEPLPPAAYDLEDIDAGGPGRFSVPPNFSHRERSL